MHSYRNQLGRFISKESEFAIREFNFSDIARYSPTFFELHKSEMPVDPPDQNAAVAQAPQNILVQIPFRIEPQKFHGKVNEDVFDYFENFIRISEANGWDEATRMSYLPAFFIDDAAHFFPSLPADIAQNFVELKKAFCREFGGDTDPVVLRYKWSNRWQTKDEKIRDYARALEKIAKRLFPIEGDITPQKRDELLRLQFIHHSLPAIKDRLLCSPCTSFSQAVQSAKEAEAQQAIFVAPSSLTSESSANTSGLSSTSTTAVATLGTFELQKCITALENSLSRVTTALDQVSTHLQQNPVRQPPPMNRGRGGFRGHGGFRGRGAPAVNNPDFTCFACGGIGHFRYQCPTVQNGGNPRGGRGAPRAQFPQHGRGRGGAPGAPGAPGFGNLGNM